MVRLKKKISSVIYKVNIIITTEYKNKVKKFIEKISFLHKLKFV